MQARLHYGDFPIKQQMKGGKINLFINFSQFPFMISANTDNYGLNM